MIFIIFSLFLQIIPPRKIKVSDPMGCDQYNDLNESGDKDKKSIIECTTENFDFSVQNSKFSNIHAKFFIDWFKSEDLPDRLIQIKNVHGSISNNIIDDCSTDENHLILCEDEADRTLNFISNKITKCYKKDGGKYEILSTSYKNNIIKYNYIECIIETKKTSRAYYIKYGRGCQFIGNTIVNAYQGDGSAMLVDSELGNDHEKFQMKDCIFKNCIGDNNDGKNGGLILVIEKINYDFIIQNTTFEDTQITSATKPDQSYLFRFESSSSTIYPVNFSNCKFIRLQSICQGTGGIGFIYNTEGEKKIIFDNTLFDNVVNSHSWTGGGALCVDSSAPCSKKTTLIVNKCVFMDCSSNNNGGAISFNSISSQLIVTDTHFIRTHVGTNKNGGAIFVNFVENTLPFLIKDCFFIDTKSTNGSSIFIKPNIDSSTSEVRIEGCNFKNTLSSIEGHSIYISKTDKNKVTISSCQMIDCGTNTNSYSIYLDVRDLDFTYNKIMFSNPEKSCGCVDLKTIGQHIFNGNYFKNARFDGSIWKSPGINGDVTDSLTSLLINNNTFDSIHGANQGRCIFIIRTNDNKLEINNNTIQNCPSGGTLIKVVCQTTINSFQIDSCKFIKNSINYEYNLIGPAPLIWFQDSTDGGDHIHPFDFTLSNCYFESNSNNRKGGGLNCGGIRYAANVKLILDNCEFLDNHAHEDGGGINIQVYQGCEIKNCKFIRNKSDEGCGSIYFETDFQCLKDNWQDQNGVLPVPSTRDLTVSITNSYFEGNIGKGSHGIRIKNSVNVKIDILECNFINCGTNDYVISIETNIQANNIKNCTFNYTTDQTSGGIYHFNDKLKLIGNSFWNFKETVIRLPLEHNLEFQLIENTFFDCQNCYLLYIERIATYCPTIKRNYFDYISRNCQLFYIRFKDDIESITIENNTFSNFVSSSEFGGIGLDISHENNNILLSFIFNDCVFKNNTNTKIGGVIYFGQNSVNAAVTLNHCFFIKNYNNDKGSSIYYNSKNGITIDHCFFSENSGLVDGVIYFEQNYQSDTTSDISIENCHFEQNKGKDSTIYLANGQTKTVKIELCDFEQDYGSIYANDFNNKVEIINNIFYKTSEKAALIINSQTKSENTITVKDCRFDSCFGSENQCFSIVVNTKQFSFLNNVLQNNKGTGCSNYFGTIDCCGEINSLDIINTSFINNTGNSLYGGGISLQFKHIQQLTFDDCKFINNEAQQDTSISRPTKDSKSYYNGDGGGFQIGYSCLLNDVNLQFQNCIFFNNSAYRHGGAISIQTIGFVKIIGCVFENNKANCLSDSSKILVDNYFDKKSEGRGGALYINPSYTYDDSSQCNSPDHYMSNVDIIKSEFKNNNAYDGYGIYFEGDDPGPSFIINIADNIFTDNYNEKNHNDDIYLIFGAVITTEILKVTEKQINDDNIFNYTIIELKVRNVSVVDHSGKTPTYAFTLSDAFTKSDLFPSNSFTQSQFFSYSSKFTGSQEFSNSHLFSGTNIFSETVDFSQSLLFSKSDSFSKSKEFTKSNQFTSSDGFTASDIVIPSPSNEFSNSNVFSNSIYFSSSNQFTTSSLFSNSEQFSRSDLFSNSNKFSSSNPFFETNVFSSSNDFSSSIQFSASNLFSESNHFSKSDSFSNSNKFTSSKQFSDTNLFSNSNVFSNSIYFSSSNQFTTSSLFSNSEQFSRSDLFSNSNEFTSSKQFSETNVFSNSNIFSSSDLFSTSNLFSESSQFSKSDSFSNSNAFTSSKQFSETNVFSNSNIFSSSDLFSASNLFSESSQFSKSDSFSSSNAFTSSKQFSVTNVFSNSNIFSSSDLFSASNLFSNSEKFSKSDLFSNSNKFTSSKQFSETNMFSSSNVFSNTKFFTKSNIFTLSDQFSKSNSFSNSVHFSRSNMFSNSDQFSKTGLFSNSITFSKTDLFSKSIQFSSSNYFSNSNQFSKSDIFSNSNDFSQSCIFSSSNQFSKSNLFSKSGLFSVSNQFSTSEQFSKSGKFSNTEHFSSSNIFSETKQFSSTNQFTQSKGFSESNQFDETQSFSYSIIFSKSNEFSQSDLFSHTQLFSESKQFSSTGQFTQSKDFSESNQFDETQSFSYSVLFSNSNEFSQSDLFSHTQLFSESKQFSSTNQFTQSNYFSKSNYFDETQSFSYSIIFSKSNEFSKSDLFSHTQLFSESKQFSETISFTQSNMFSQSDKFTNTNLFSLSNKFSNSFYFSKTGLFSQSKDFTKSRLFSQSAMFSVSNQFSNSHLFTNSNYFSISKQFSQTGLFSESNHFTQSDPLNTKEFEPTEKFSESASFTMSELFKEPKCILYEEDGNMTILTECNYSMNNKRPVLVKVISTNFTYMTNTINGTAIHIDNCGLLCNRTLFLDCVTSNGCGGAIYIRNDVDLRINITLESLIFIKCEAKCGGAVFIYSHIDENEVLIKNCSFLSNKVHKSNNFNLFGGSAIYLASNNVDIADCLFRENVGYGGACKLESINNNNLRILQIDQIQNPIKISGCLFENDRKSDSSIFYLNENRSNLIQITQCSFKGKLKNGSNYIDGKTTDNEKIQIKDCDFDYDLDKSFNASKWKKTIICSFIFLSSFILIIIKLIKWNKNKEEFNNQDLIDKYNENRNQLLNDL